MAVSLQRPPFKSPSHCISKSAKTKRQELLDLVRSYNSTQLPQRQLLGQFDIDINRRRQNPEHHHYPHFPRPSGHLNHHRNSKKFQQQQQLQLQQRKRKLLKYFQTFQTLSNGCIACPNGRQSNVTAAAHAKAIGKPRLTSTCREHVLEPSLQITYSPRFKSLASDDTNSRMNHSELSTTTFCLQPISIE